MNQFTKKRNIAMQCAVVLATALFIANAAHSSPTSDDQSLVRGAVEDVTPQQKYRSAIREAGGAYKESLRECDRVMGDERRACTREAKQTYDRDMADAKLFLSPRPSTPVRSGAAQ